MKKYVNHPNYGKILYSKGLFGKRMLTINNVELEMVSKDTFLFKNKLVSVIKNPQSASGYSVAFDDETIDFDD